MTSSRSNPRGSSTRATSGCIKFAPESSREDSRAKADDTHAENRSTTFDVTCGVVAGRVKGTGGKVSEGAVASFRNFVLSENRRKIFLILLGKVTCENSKTWPTYTDF